MLRRLTIAGVVFWSGCCQLSFEAQCCVSHPDLHPELCGAEEQPVVEGLPESCEETPAAALAVMEDYCTSCHGDDGSSQGGFYYARDFERMVATSKGDLEDPDATIRSMSRA